MLSTKVALRAFPTRISKSNFTIRHHLATLSMPSPALPMSQPSPQDIAKLREELATVRIIRQVDEERESLRNRDLSESLHAVIAELNHVKQQLSLFPISSDIQNGIQATEERLTEALRLTNTQEHTEM